MMAVRTQSCERAALMFGVVGMSLGAVIGFHKVGLFCRSSPQGSKSRGKEQFSSSSVSNSMRLKTQATRELARPFILINPDINDGPMVRAPL